MEHQLKFGSRVIDFSLQYKERKSLGIKVHPEGQVEVISPLTAKEKDVMENVRKKAPWILKQIDSFNSYKPTTPKRRFINGETHLYLGRQYRLKIVHNKENAVKAYQGQLQIHSSIEKPTVLKELLERWYKEKAKLVFNQILRQVFPKFKRYKLVTPVLNIRTMSKRWGSCTPSGKISLNPELIKAPKGSIEYVIIHELCHLVHHNHTKAFRNLLYKMMPDWTRWKEKLEYTLS